VNTRFSWLEAATNLHHRTMKTPSTVSLSSPLWKRRIRDLLILATAGFLRAEFVQPVAVTVSNGEETKDALIDGLGLEDQGVGTPDSLHVTAASEMWSSIGSIRADVVFDLGRVTDLTRVYVWNYSAGTDTDRGMKEVEVHVSPDADPATARFTGIATVTLAEGGTAAQAFDVVGTDVRLVKLRNTSNWGNGYSIGLAEVRFETGEIAGNVPVVGISNLKEGDTVPLGSDFSLLATVTDRDSNLSKVEFFDGGAKLSEAIKAPYSTSLKTLAQGEHTLRVVATDQAGMTAFASVNVTVREVVPGTVVSIDDTRDIGAGVNQIRYSGTWNLAQGNANDPRFLNNDHYADGGGAYFEIKFVGVKIDVFATVASHHGTASAVIDGGTRYVLSYKAAQRGEQKLIWSSPLLPNRAHTLKVSVLGTGVVTADRFDVTQSDTPSEDRAVVKRWDASLSRFTLDLEDLGPSVVDPSTVTLKIDGSGVPVQVSKAGPVTTVVYDVPMPFAPGTQHPFKVEARDTLGNVLGTEASFTVPAPPFPLTGMGEPAGTVGAWSVRQVWNAGRADAVVTGVEIARSVGSVGFAGKYLDAPSPVINFNFTPSPGNGGLFGDDLPFPGETQELPANDWVTVARAKVRIPRDGDWTLGVHSDDGFALRFAGHPFASVSGGGVIDEDFPEYLLFAVATGDSNTRGVLKGVRAGDYAVEFIHFQRVGGGAAEIYAAEGEFVEDGDTGAWALIGSVDGLQLVADDLPIGPFSLGSIQFADGSVTIDFESPRPGAIHSLLESANLKEWAPVSGAVFISTGGNGMRATVSNRVGNEKFYRVNVAP
jgi:Bacterial Ig domain